MPSMANANRFIRSFAIPFVIVVYAVVLWIDQDHNDDPAVKEHIRQIKNSGSVEGLIFGGSNAIYSLSAELLSSHFGARWYNASVNDEMHRVSRYNDFIQDLAGSIDRMKVEYVVYSSQLPYINGNIAAHESTKIEKIAGFGIKPKLSVAYYIVSAYRNHPNERERRVGKQRNEFGDLVFDNVKKCEFDGDISHERENEDTSVNFLTNEVLFLGAVFPYAAIFMVLPSEYYGEKNLDDSVFEQNLRTKFYKILNRKYHFKDRAVKIIFQPPYSSIAQVCNEKEHANKQGRLWRTRNLIDFMPSVQVTSFSRISTSAIHSLEDEALALRLLKAMKFDASFHLTSLPPARLCPSAWACEGRSTSNSPNTTCWPPTWLRRAYHAHSNSLGPPAS
jgi:hypothetical protein